MTGTQIQNSMLDLYALLKYLNFHPLNEKPLFSYLYQTSKNELSAEEQRRTKCWNLLLSEFLVLRRNKTDKIKGTDKLILDLPGKEIDEIKFELSDKERYIYDKVFKESQNGLRELLETQNEFRNLLKNQRVKVRYR